MPKPPARAAEDAVPGAAPGRAEQPARPARGMASVARRYMLVSIAAAVITITLKVSAYLLTDSIGLFSDAAESVINLVAATAAFVALTVAARPPDTEHAYGHTKAEYFSSGLEGGLILVAAGAIAVTATGRLFHPQPLENLGVGLVVSLVATAVNGGSGSCCSGPGSGCARSRCGPTACI